MRRILLLTIFALSIFTSKSQQLSFTCPRDTVLGCNSTCFTLKGQFPDLRGLADDYTFKNVTAASACRPYVDPGGPGPSTSLTIDDTYSSVINLPFNFVFYGTVYNSLVVSTNGYISFDASNLTGNFSDYGIMNSGGFLTATAGNPPENLPSPLYDGAIIMGPYHDLNPAYTTSPAMQIKYNVFGTAPNRKWILSFYKVPLFTNAGGGCDQKIDNTHQIILHESTGVIEVFIRDKEICPGWNEGRAMVGMQDITKSKGIMAPGRAASDNPWGNIGMNETWRFIPKNGSHLYRSLQLLDATGAVIATGDTTRVDANTFEWSFPNVCPPAGASIYVIKTTYQKIDDPTPGATIFSLDTINVTRTPSLPLNESSVSTACGLTTGTITVTAAGGVGPYTFTLSGPGGPYAPVVSATNTTTFTNLGAGPYTVTVTDGAGCTGTVNVTVNNIPNLTGTYLATGITCPGLTNGTITITPDLGAAAGPYTYTLTGPGGPFIQLGLPSAATFAGLTNGTYSVTFVNTAGCSGTINNMVVTPGTAPTASISHVNVSCTGAANGSVTITLGASAGAGPYNVTLNPVGTFQNNVSSPVVFNNLPAGPYTATFTNASGCTGTTSSTTVGTNTSPTASISGGFTSCFGASDGTVTVTPAGGAAQGPYDITLNPIGIVLTGVATVGVFTGIPAGPYTATFTNAAGCSGTTITAIVANGAPLSATISSTNTSCPGVSDGTVTVTPNAGAAGGPYNITLNPGGIVQNGVAVSATFTGLAIGPYTATFTSAGGCSGTTPGSATVSPGAAPTSTFTQFDPPCYNISNGTITIIPGGSPGISYTLTGPGPNPPITQPGPTFTNLATGTYSYNFTDANGCVGTGGPIVLTTHNPLTTTVVLTEPLCKGNANGVITLNAAGGLGPYSYSLSPFTVQQPTGVFAGLIAGTYTFRITDNAGCTKDTTVTLGEPTLLTASANSPSPASCDGNDGTITVTGAGGTPAYTYSIDGINYQPGNTFVAPAVGAYPNIKVKDANGCIANASTTVVLVDNMFLTLGNDTTICVEKSITFQPQTNANTSIFIWRPLDPVITPLSTIADPNIKNAIATPTDTATYILHAEWGACVREDTIVVNVLHKPVPNAGLDTMICNNTFAILRGSASNLSGTVNYAWAPVTDIADPTSAVTTVTPPGSDTTYTYTLTVTDNYGCNFSVSDAVNVHVQPPVPAFAGNDTTAILGVPHQLFGSGGVDYLWSPAAPLNLATAQNPLATLDHDQQFVLKVTDIAGCIGYATVLIQVYQGPDYYIPNAFSPNGDGVNDVFRAIPVGMAKTDYFRVFNRYGQLMFETKEWLKGWDGRYKGKTQPMGAYVWVVKGVDKNGRIVEMKGTVMLVQ